MTVSPKQKKIALVAGGALVLYLLYRWYENNAANNAASAQAGTPLTPTTDGSGDVGGGATSGGFGGMGGTLDSDLQALMAQDAQNNAGLIAAIQALQPNGTGSGTASSSTTGDTSGTGMISGPLNALPIAAQIALVQAGLADPSQLGAKAQTVYSHGDTTLAQYATGEKKAPRGQTSRQSRRVAMTAAEARTLGSQLAGYVNHAYDPHKAGSAVAPSHHGPKPTKAKTTPAPRPKAPNHVTPTKPPTRRPSSRKR